MRTLTEAKQRKMARLFLVGESKTKIAKKVGCSPTTVSSYWKRWKAGLEEEQRDTEVAKVLREQQGIYSGPVYQPDTIGLVELLVNHLRRVECPHCKESVLVLASVLWVRCTGCKREFRMATEAK